MAKICILSALLLQLFYTSVQGQNSPCLDHNGLFNFTYIKEPGRNNRKELSDEMIGQIEIRDPPINNLEVHLKVDFKVATQLPTSYVGGVDLTKSKEDAARDVLEGRPLLYHIYFPVQTQLLTVYRIWFNNDQICSGPEVSGNVVTTITLEHTLKIIIQPNQSNPPHQNRLEEQKPPRSSQQVPRPTPQPTSRPALRRAPRQAPRSTPLASVDKIENYNECGIRRSHSGNPSLLIAHGNKTLPGQWPWVAAIFTFMYEYEFLCGGTILTAKHVLTAGHCLKRSPRTNQTTPVHILYVALGRYKLMDFNEQGSVTMDVATYIFHPEYTHTVTADSDLAIIILRSPVEFTDFIRPICLLPPSVVSRKFEQTDGIIVGWGEDEHGHFYTEEPRLANMPIVRTDVCFRSHPSFFFISSERTFCAGGPNLTVSGACKGDSGSGLVIFDSVTGRYYLRGVVSRTLGNQLFCDQTNYIIFVDVFKYLLWINNTLEIIIQPPQNQPNPSPQNIPTEQEPFRPSQQAPQSYSQSTPQTTLRPTTASVDEIVDYSKCGISGSHRGGPNFLIARGNKTSPGQWPWVAAIFRVTHEHEFLCGGTILTAKHVLTAAHCLKMLITNETIPANMLSVALGRYRLQDFHEQGSVNMDVARHIIHLGYKHTASADSNLAVLILRSPVEFTAFIRPICLLHLASNFRRFKRKSGIIVGWGEDEHGNHYTEELRMSFMSIFKTHTCIQRHVAFIDIISNRTFCAGWWSRSGPCNDDNGSGLVVFDSETSRYQLRGIASRGLVSSHLSCNQTHYVVFVDVFKYLPWINQQIYTT